MEQTSTTSLNIMAPMQEILRTEYLGESNVLNLLPAAVYVCDASGLITHYNKKAVALWGRTPKKGDNDDRFCGSYKLYYPNGEYMPHNQTPVAACLTDGLPKEDLEVVIERPDLTRRMVRVNIVPIKDEQGNLLGMVNCFYDITEQKKMQKELEWKTKQLQDYVDNAPIGLHWVDEKGIITWANFAELNMLGYTEDEYIGHHISEFHTDEATISDILHRLSCNETINNYESTLRCKDGSYRTVQISSNVFWDEGRFIHTRCFTIDVTEEKKLFTALQQSETRYRELIENLQTPLYTTDAQGRITLYNKAAADLWGREPEIGKDLWCGSYRIMNTDGTELPLDECPMAVCLREQRAVYGEEILVVRTDGSLRNVAPFPQPIFNEKKELTGAINMLVDVTELKETENALRESEQKYRELAASLEKKVAEKTRDLHQKNETLEKLNQNLEEFAYAASHDMKEPIRKITYYNSAILQALPEHIDEKAKDYLTRSVNAAKRMDQLLDDLIAYSRMSTDTEAFEKVELLQVIKEIELLHTEELEQQTASLVYGELPVISGVPFQMKQLLENLVNNAIKYKHSDRKAVIKISSQVVSGSEIGNPKADSSAWYHNISVTDNGTGFDQQYAEKIFTVFQRLNNVPGVKGSGLGLAICRKIVHNHHGFIRASGTENEGARFDIWLPVAN